MKTQLKDMADQTTKLTSERKDLKKALADVNSVRASMMKKTPEEKTERSRARKTRLRDRVKADQAELVALRAVE